MSFGKPPKRLEIFSTPDLPVWICGTLRVDPAEGRVLREGRPVALTPKAFELLVFLLSRHGRLVTRHELLAALWPDTFVDESNLTGAVWAVRKALGPGERWIETVPKLGYRFIGPVHERSPAPHRESTRTERRIGSLAVIPLVNLSADPEQEYFVDGMTDALITDLARISALRVISRTTVMRYKGTHLRLPEVARQLNVEGVIEGSVLRVGDRVRVTTQLVHAATDTHVWAERYDRPLADVLSLHREVARTIAREIQVTLTRDERVRLSQAHVTRPDAHEAYLRGRHHWRQVTDDGFSKARDCLRQAIALDPLFAEAHAALADAQVALSAFGVVRPEGAIAEAEASARRALALDPNLGDAHRTMAMIRMYYWDWPGAEAAFDSAMAAAPGSAETHCHYSLLLVARGRCEEATAAAEHARSLDPLSPMIHNDRAFVLWTARRYGEAIDGYRQTLDLEPHFVEARRELGLLHAFLGDVDAGLPELERAVTLSRDVESLAYLGYALASAGRERAARAILAELEATANSRHVESFARAVVHLGLRDHDSALEWLERGYEERSWSLLWLRSWPLFDPLRAIPRFRALLARIGGVGVG
jgi:TolB-like protein/tetratricopeptide (TPR) repeat protein